MTPSPRPSRHDPYRFIHKGLRAALLHSLIALGRADAADPDGLGAALAGADELIALLLEHMRQENHFFHVAIEARRAGGSKPLADEHTQLREELVDLQDEVARLRRTATQLRGAQLHALYHGMCAMAASQLAHMQREEDELNPLLWAHYTDDELRAIHLQLLSASDPALLRVLIGWMATALGQRELAALLALVRRLVAPADFAALLEQLQARASTAADRARIERALSGVATG